MKTNKLTIAIALSLGSSFTAQAQFSVILDLSDLNGNNGFVINGENESDNSGKSVSSAGDINGDGINDLIIGAPYANSNGNTEAGSSYVVFGNTSSLPNSLDLSSINGTNGFVIHGENAGDYSGVSVSSAGDINDDGVDDLIIGAHGTDPNGNDFSGSSYVVFGSTSSLPNQLNLSSINGTNGFVIQGVNTGDYSGFSVSAAGDINGDGVDDLIVGAKYANSYAGSSYVVFGNTSSLPNPLNLSSINGANGFVIHGENASDFSGISVSAAGDINGDDVDDLIIGAHGTDPIGSSYVVFGSTSSLPSPLNLSSINGTNGFVIHGENAGDDLGKSVSSAGDFNDDGIDDLIISASRATPNGDVFAGSSYVIFGSTSSLPNPLNLTSINGANGFVIHGESTNDRSGTSVSFAGDVNADGIDDLIIGAPNGNTSTGSSYVVFGSTSSFPNPLNLSSINGIDGFIINGESADHHSGQSVSSAGDINGDGIDDFLIGANGANAYVGSTYVVFGNDIIFSNDFD